VDRAVLRPAGGREAGPHGGSATARALTGARGAAGTRTGRRHSGHGASRGAEGGPAQPQGLAHPPRPARAAGRARSLAA